MVFTMLVEYILARQKDTPPIVGRYAAVTKTSYSMELLSLSGIESITYAKQYAKKEAFTYSIKNHDIICTKNELEKLFHHQVLLSCNSNKEGMFVVKKR